MEHKKEKGKHFLALDIENLTHLANISLISLLETSKREKIGRSLSLAEFVELAGLVKSLSGLTEPDFSLSSLEKRQMPIKERGGTSLQSILEATKKQGLLQDFVGITRRIVENNLVFSTIVGKRPKPYLSMYLLFAGRLKRRIPDLKFYVHLEDWFPRNYLGEVVTEKSVKAYCEYIKKFGAVDEIFMTSSVPRKRVPQEFIEYYLSQITVDEFISILPFQKHSIEKARVSDLVHFIWNLYLIFYLRGVYLTSINSRREFLIFRKALGKYPPVIFFPLAPESISNPTDLEFYNKYISFSQMFKARGILGI